MVWVKTSTYNRKSKTTLAYLIHIQNQSNIITVEVGRTILESAIAQGMDYPHGCRSGNCGACKSVLHQGDVEMSPYSEFALTEEERARGLILACRSVPWSDCTVSPVDQDETVVHASRRLICKVTGLEQVTHDTQIVRLAIEQGGPYDFSAGQYAEVTFGNLPARDFSMANRPEQKILEFHVRRVQDGLVSPYINDHLDIGEMVKVSGPLGTAYYREKHTGPIIAVAGGSGLAPIKSIVETALAQGARQEIFLYFGVRDERDIYLENYFNSLSSEHSNLNFIPILSEPLTDTKRRTGFLADILAQDFSDLDGYKAYLAGPPIMVETSVKKLKHLEIRVQDIHADAFYTEAEKAVLEKSL